jgi:hypothetical protein
MDLEDPEEAALEPVSRRVRRRWLRAAAVATAGKRAVVVAAATTPVVVAAGIASRELNTAPEVVVASVTPPVR